MSFDSDSDSSSCSSSSSSGAGYGRAARLAAAQISGEGSRRIAAPLAASSAAVPVQQQQQRLKAVPMNVAAPTPDMMNQGELAKPAQIKYDTVEYDFAIKASPATLQQLPGGGSAITLDQTLGLSKPRYSNPADGKAEMLKHGACDFVKSVRIDLMQTTGLPLQVTVPVHAMQEEAAANPATVSADAPHGFVSAKVDQGKDLVVLDRTIVDAQANFIQKYPGQTADKLDAWMFAMPTDASVTYIQAKPESAVLHFYRQLAAAKDAPISAESADARGMASGSSALLAEAKALAKARIPAAIAYSNVTDPAKFSITFNTLPETELKIGTDGKAMASQSSVALSHGYLSSANYQNVARFATPMDVKRTQQLASTEPLIQLRGKVVVEYVKVHPNFQYVAADA
jgi:hypothetical protein